MKWLMVIYRLPRSKTSAAKVAIWRKLKKLGVCWIQDSVFVMPDSEKNLENCEWLAAELREMGGEAFLWEARSLSQEQERRVRDFFLEQVNAEYRNIIKEAASVENRIQLRQLWAWYNKIKSQDYLKSPLAAEARAACEERAGRFTEEVPT